MIGVNDRIGEIMNRMSSINSRFNRQQSHSTGFKNTLAENRQTPKTEKLFSGQVPEWH